MPSPFRCIAFISNKIYHISTILIDCVSFGIQSVFFSIVCIIRYYQSKIRPNIDHRFLWDILSKPGIRTLKFPKHIPVISCFYGVSILRILSSFRQHISNSGSPGDLNVPLPLTRLILNFWQSSCVFLWTRIVRSKVVCDKCYSFSLLSHFYLLAGLCIRFLFPLTQTSHFAFA